MPKHIYTLEKIDGKRFFIKDHTFLFIPEICAYRFEPGVKGSEAKIVSRRQVETYIMAAKLAKMAHHGQKEKSTGKEYFTHPCRVSQRVRCKTLETWQIIEVMTVGLLHDVVEDTPVTIRDLQGLCFNHRITLAVNYLTKRESVDYLDYVKNLLNNTYAKEVKRADLIDNMDVSRLVDFTKKDAERMKKYKKAFDMIEAAKSLFSF